VILKRSSKFSAWSTVLVGFCLSLVSKYLINAETVGSILGVENMSEQELNDTAFFSALFINIILGSLWYLATVYFFKSKDPKYRELEDDFHKDVAREVVVDDKQSAPGDVRQLSVLAYLCLTYGGFIILLFLIPNPLIGRLCFVFAGGVIALIGYLLLRQARKIKKRYMSSE
ncbi:MAG TPA: hypothetical protein VKS21_06710, partial [Spirochaetota bacterium]|nr:hypothetical protein [Spirochaetota bacterium]